MFELVVRLCSARVVAGKRVVRPSCVPCEASHHKKLPILSRQRVAAPRARRGRPPGRPRLQLRGFSTSPKHRHRLRQIQPGLAGGHRRVYYHIQHLLSLFVYRFIFQSNTGRDSAFPILPFAGPPHTAHARDDNTVRSYDDTVTC